MIEWVQDNDLGLIIIVRSSRLLSKGKIYILPTMPCEKCRMNFVKHYFEKKSEKLAIFKLRHFDIMFVNLAHLLRSFSLMSRINLQGFAHIWLRERLT